MGLPATDDFVGGDGDPIPGRTTTTGALTWANAGGTNNWQINANRAYGGAAGGICLLDAGTGNIDTQLNTVSAGGQFTIIIFRSTNNASQYLQAWFEQGANRIRLFDEALNQIGPTSGLAVNNGSVCRVTANGTAVSLYVDSVLAFTTTTAHGQTNTYCGIRDGTGGSFVDNYSLAAFTVTTPTATLTRATPIDATLDGTSGTGGTGPYTYQWQRSTSPTSGFANLANGSGVSGATTLTLIDGSAGIAAGTRYFYQLVVTDSLAATFTSNVCTAAKWSAPWFVGFIGDSVTTGFGGTTDPVIQFDLAAKCGGGRQRDGIVYNGGISGTKSSDWYDSAGAGVTANTTAFVAAALAAGALDCVVTLGINNAYSAETVPDYQADLAGLCAYLLANGFNRVILNYPSGIPASEGAAYQKLLDLAATIPNVVNGTTILQGDTEALAFFPDHVDELQDPPNQVHPNDAGYRNLGQMWAFAFARAVGELGSGGVSGARIFGGF